MKKSTTTTIISIIALVVALAGIGVALYTFFKRSGCYLCDSFDDEMLSDDLYAECDCDECAEETTEE